MKSIYPFLLLLTLSFQSFYSEAKSHFTDIELIVYNTDLYASDHTPIAFKLTKENGTVRFTKGYGEGALGWHRVDISSDQAKVAQGHMYINRSALIANNHVIELHVTIKQGKHYISKCLEYRLPEIEGISLNINTILPYTIYEKIIAVETLNKTYYLTPKSQYAGFRYEDFQLEFRTSLIQSTQEEIIFRPNFDTNPSKVSLFVKNQKLNLDTLQWIYVKQLENFKVAFIGRNGSDGSSGIDGSCGDLGEDGEDGGWGYDGDDGQAGSDVHLIISKVQNKIIVQIFQEGSFNEYLLPIYCTFLANITGGNGGDGGSGGSGGSGGDADAEGNCGSDGDDGYSGTGGSGGNGGNIKVYSDMLILDLANIIIPITSGGKGGSGYNSPQNGRKGSVEYIILNTSEIEDMLEQETF
jgi:hypothetical protein